MKKALRIIVPILLVLLILSSVVWYVFVYDRDLTRDVLLKNARYFFNNRRPNVASWFYDLAYRYADQDENVAIELAEQFKAEGNYTQAEHALSGAIADGGTAELYMALCKTYVEQDKLLDAVTMLDNIGDAKIKLELDRLRPAAPVANPEPGFYNAYIPVILSNEGGTLYYSTDGEYPSTASQPYQDPIILPGGETTIYAVTVDDKGLVSPLSILGYTVGGVIEEVTFADPAIERDIRDILEVGPDATVYTSDLWTIKNFLVPDDAESFEDLSKLIYLEQLTIRDMDVGSLQFLSTMTSLVKLNLPGCTFDSDDLALIPRLTHLERLDLSGCSLSTVSGLAHAPALTYLNLNNNTVRNLDALSTIHTLKEVLLQHNAVTALDALSGLSELTKLDLTHNSVSSMAPLGSCANLTWLDLSYNSLSSLENVSSLLQLSHLNARNNALTEVGALAGVTALTELDISHNQIESIAPLGSLAKLEKLDFSYNTVTELPRWPDKSALETVSGSYNQITDITNLKYIEHLNYVTLDYNQIDSVGCLSNCLYLIQVSVSGNPVKDAGKLTEKGIIVNYDPV